METHGIFLTFLAVPSPVASTDTVAENLSLVDGAQAFVAAWRMCVTYILQIIMDSLTIHQYW